MKSKCKCGDVFGFKVSEALQFIAVPEREQALRRFVSETKRGCIGRLTFPGTGQSSGCIHIPRAQLPANMLRSMDEGTALNFLIHILPISFEGHVTEKTGLARTLKVLEF